MLISTENTEDFWAKLLSLPSWERGLKHVAIMENISVHQSLPSWERGLKPYVVGIYTTAHASLPSWERGLKLQRTEQSQGGNQVAPLVGAWIETLTATDVMKSENCRSPRGSVD